MNPNQGCNNKTAGCSPKRGTARVLSVTKKVIT